MNVFVIIPAYNAAEKIAGIVREIVALGYRVVVVDDGSNDDTCARACKETPHTLRHLVNRGQGAALSTGMHYALSRGAEILVHFDADGQQKADEIERVIGPIANGSVDAVLGSRILGSSDDVRSTLKSVQFHGKKIVDRFFSGVSLTDVHCGFRAFSRAAACRIEITQDRMAHATEIIAELGRSRARFCEVPVTLRYTEYSRNQSANKKFIRASFRILKELIVGKVVVKKSIRSKMLNQK